MSHRFERSKKRRARFEAEFETLRNLPVTGTHAIVAINEKIRELFDRIDKSPEGLLVFVERVMGPKPESSSAAEEWDRVIAIAQQIVAPHLAVMTPGNVYARGNRKPLGKAMRSS